jgi:hypothetical protein
MIQHRYLIEAKVKEIYFSRSLDLHTPSGFQPLPSHYGGKIVCCLECKLRGCQSWRKTVHYLSSEPYKFDIFEFSSFFALCFYKVRILDSELFYPSFDTLWVRYLSSEKGNIGNLGDACEIQVVLGVRKVNLKVKHYNRSN